MKGKKIAICLFGHLRTYRWTYRNFVENIIEVNRKSGYEIDVFMHTWDVFCDFNTRHRDNLEKLYPTLWNKKVDDNVIEDFVAIYQPKAFAVETGSGMYESVARVSEIYLEHKSKTKTGYDFILYARYDVMYFTPFDFKVYIEPYYAHNEQVKREVPTQITFSCMNYFSGLSFMDPRFVNEGDMLWVNNFDCKKIPPREAHSFFVVPIKYSYCIDFMAYREIADQYDMRLRLLTLYSRKMPWVPTMWQEIQNIMLSPQPKAITKEVIKEKVIVKEKPTPSIYPVSAKDRIHSHLAYKLGSAMILNSKSLWGYIRMPYVLSYIKEAHKKEIADYEAKVAKNPKLKLPKLESYTDYKEALREKECFTYKLGEALITANSVRGGGRIFAYLAFFQEVRKLKRELKEKRK